jgi:hypothetical protein
MFADALSNALGIRRFRLAGPAGDGRHAYLNEEGAFLGSGVALVTRSADKWGNKTFIARPEAALARLWRAASGTSIDTAPLARRLAGVAEALNKGERALAAIRLVQAEIDPLADDAAATRLAKVDRLLKAGFNPGELRLPRGVTGGGQWADGGDGAAASPNVQPAAARGENIQAKKEAFVDAHLADAQKAADKLGVPVEDILGLMALESGWGTDRFAADGNNYFNIYYPAPYAIDWVKAHDSNARIAVFASAADGLASFAAESGSTVQGVRDPAAFAAALQNSGRYGIDPDSGKKVVGYVEGLAATIRGLASIVEQRKL